MISLIVSTAESAPVTDIGPRTLMTLAMFAIIGLSFLGMRKGWQKRAKREVAQISSSIPTGVTALTEKHPARFAGTTISGKWLDRITNYGLGTPRSSFVQIFDQGIYVTDALDFNLWIDKSDIKNVGTKRGIAGDVVEKDGMLVITWQLGDLLLDSGIRVNRHQEHELVISAVTNFPKNVNTASTQQEMGNSA